ncbi:MAG TPA: Rieske 2Fe-2S domain-containing protein [Dermatophilaceae bacterium]|nr:Rieske 2Fe-2S domain-containing protein [Dermatophilaceae bacterium]
MNAQGTPPQDGVAGDGHAAAGAAVDRAHAAGALEVPDRFDNPGLPPHVQRAADLDPKAAKRAERQVVGLFVVSVLASLSFLVAYFVVDDEATFFMPFFGQLLTLHTILGVALGLSLLCIGLAAVHWAKTLMPDEESVEERHPVRATEENRQGVVETLREGGEKAQIGRRPLIAVTGGAALGLFALPPLLQLVGGLGPVPGSQLSETFWQAGMRLMREPGMTPIRADEVTLGSVYHVLPEGIDKNLNQKPQLDAEGNAIDFRFDEDLGLLERKAKAATLMVRLKPEEIKSDKQRSWGYDGIVAHNKICTHAGCPVGLYEQTTQHLLCPCHQTTFDVANDCEVVFGPGKRALPQLRISVDKEGYLIATQGFTEPVGPSFWERG